MVLPFSDMSKDDLKNVEKVKSIGAAITGDINVNIPECSITLKLHVPENNPEARQVADNLMSMFPQQLATQLKAFFGIAGVIHRKKQ